LEIQKNKLGEGGRQFHSSPPGAKLPSYATAVVSCKIYQIRCGKFCRGPYPWD